MVSILVVALNVGPSSAHEQHLNVTAEHEPRSRWDIYLYLGHGYGVRYQIRRAGPMTPKDKTKVHLTYDYELQAVRMDPTIIGIVQVEQFPWEGVPILDRAPFLNSLILWHCNESLFSLSPHEHINSHTWCLMVLEKLWMNLQLAKGAVLKSQIVRIESRLWNLQGAIFSWVQRIAHGQGILPQVRPVAFWRLSDWPWMAFYGVPGEWEELRPLSN